MEAKLESSNRDIPYLPPHVIEEIFHRLDVQTLFQSSFICRDWNKLITSFDFMLRSSSLGLKNQILLIKACHCKESAENFEREYIHFPYCRVTYSLHWDNNQFDLSHKIEIPTVDDFKEIEMIGVSNGLICLASILPFKFILWNPIVRKYAWLPHMMDWDESLSIVGFGFDCSAKNFKIVNILFHRYIDDMNIAGEFDSVCVFSYATWSWKRLTCNSILNSCSIYRGKPTVCFNGVLHWIAHLEAENYDFILTFDLAREMFGQILLPKDMHHYGCLNFLAATEESLLFTQEDLLEHFEEERFCHFYTWTMKEYGNHESWIRTSSLKMKIKMGPEHVLGVRKNGDLILEMEEGQIYKYNPTSPTDIILVGAMENSVLFHYYSASLYLLEKDDVVNSY